MSDLLIIKNLSVKVKEKLILSDLNLKIKKGAIHAIMGPNGSGKSSLCLSIMGHPDFSPTSGEIYFNNQDLLAMPADERSRKGIFLAFQSPQEIEGLSFGNFLRQAVNLRKKEKLRPIAFYDEMKKLLKRNKLDESFISRGVNEGLSGGEKKRTEIVQMIALKPKLAIFDEIDSGLDIDSLKNTAKLIKEEKKSSNAIILISHYQRLFKYLKPDFVHVLIDGKIVESGDSSLAKKIEKEGFFKLYS